MSYLVLARKWRPRRFSELVGQEHVVRALTNALDSGRVHHAFLFTGTRGVGKTTIARIFAKSLNCERGASSDPCGECETCLAIDAGRYIDLLEIDAASNTGVDNVRDLIENAQYMPSRGRYKVYLIDEVHMLSKPAFNALLKTLEEPPEHVKFLFATTDPEKLLVTVLSRCLQFNLKRLDEAQIGGQVRKILAAEGIAAEDGAIRQLAKAADGSLRDGLSLLDQAIAYTGVASGGATLEDAAVATMLGTVDRTQVGTLLDALAEGDGSRVLATVAALAEFSPDWAAVLDALAAALHAIQVRQLVPDAALEAGHVDVDALASRLRPELVQLWYQMALHGRRDLPLAPAPRSGFEMCVLRMLAFRPAEQGAGQAAPPSGREGGRDPAAAARAALAAEEPGPRGRVAAASSPYLSTGTAGSGAPSFEKPIIDGHGVGEQAFEKPAPEQPAPEKHALDKHALEKSPLDTPSRDVPVATPASGASTSASPLRSCDTGPATPIATARIDAERWLELVAASPLRGPARELAVHAGFIAHEGELLRLSLSPADEHLKAPALVKMLAEALAPTLGGAPQIRFEAAPAAGETLHERSSRDRDARQVAAEAAFVNDPGVQRLMSRHGAKIVPDSIRPFDEA